MEAQATRLRAAGYDVRVIAGRGRAEIVEEVSSRHSEVERVTRSLAAAGNADSAFERLQRRLRERLDQLLEDRDLIIAHNVLTMPFNLPLAAALLELRRPLLAWTHDLAWLDDQYAAYRRHEWPFSLLAAPQHGVTYVAISRLRQLDVVRTFGLSPRQVPVVPNGLDPLEFAGLGRAAMDLLSGAGALDAAPLVLVPLRITPRKRLELALETAAALRPRLPHLRVLVTGPVGPHSFDNLRYADRLLDQRAQLGLTDVVHFLFQQAPPGHEHPVRARDVAELYRISDVVLIPSEAEGFGLPILEAALARVPVVCRDLPVLREVGGAGLHTFPATADGEQVAEAVERALSGRPGKQRRRAIMRYSWPQVLARTEGVIGAVLGR